MFCVCNQMAFLTLSAHFLDLMELKECGGSICFFCVCVSECSMYLIRVFQGTCVSPVQADQHLKNYDGQREGGKNGWMDKWSLCVILLMQVTRKTWQKLTNLGRNKIIIISSSSSILLITITSTVIIPVIQRQFKTCCGKYLISPNKELSVHYLPTEWNSCKRRQVVICTHLEHLFLFGSVNIWTKNLEDLWEQ